MFYIHRGGIVFYGGFVGGVLGAWIYARIKKLDFWKLADLLAPSLVLAHAFGRLGCFMNGCCYGKSCSLPWGVEFPAGTVADWGPGAPLGPVHPTQLYEAAFLFYFSFALMIIDRGKKFEGQTVASYGLIYALFRFIVEFWRGDVPRYNSLTASQWLSIVIFGACWWWLTRQRKRWAMAKREEILVQVEQLKRQQAGELKSQPAKGRKKRPK
jgi:phosphatidylglycerol:prolipoprotein diacylglycerol transferase